MTGDSTANRVPLRPGTQPPGPSPDIPDHEMLRLIGSGSYGQVWLARNVMGQFKAVKVIHRDRFEDARPYEREFEGICRFEPVSHFPSQVNISHVGRNDRDGYFYYVMELADDASCRGPKSKVQSPKSSQDGAVNAEGGAGSPKSKVQSPKSSEDGGRDEESRENSIQPESYVPRTLRSELKERGRLPFNECLDLGLALTAALSHLHNHGLVHRDVKAANVIFVGGQPKLADIGLVAAAEAECSFVGTEGYVPPEGPGGA